MNKFAIAAVVTTGVALSGGGAFTASNPVDASTAGYGEAVVSGVTVTDIDYTLDAAADSVSSIAFTASSNMLGKNLVLKLQNAGADVATASNAAAATNACVITAVTGLGATCSFATAVDVDTFDGLAITVYDKD